MSARKEEEKKPPSRREQIRELQSQGLTQKQIGEKLGLSRGCVARYIKKMKRYNWHT